MQEPLPARAPASSVPTFYLTSRQRLSPAAILLAVIIALGGLNGLRYALRHGTRAKVGSETSAAQPSSGAGSGAAPDDDKDDDPDQIDTIVLGDPSEAPAPARARRGNHVSSVHPTILIRLPRSGDKVGLIPNSEAGHLLFDWLKAFNEADASALEKALPTLASGSAAAAQMTLRQQTGGFNLLSGKDVQPGVLVFRLRDQTPAATEVLGTLQVRPNSMPPVIGSFSLRAVPAQTPEDAPHTAGNAAAR